MKKLTIAIAVSSALISGASFAGNTDTMIFQSAEYNEVNVTQNTTGGDPANGHHASETILYGDYNKINVTQTGERNRSKTEINGEKYKNSDYNKLRVEQDGDDNKSSIILGNDADGNTAKVKIYGSSFLGSSDHNTTRSTFGDGADDNRLMINIKKGSYNMVKTSVADHSDGNKANVDIHFAAHNKVIIAQDGNDNRSNVHIAVGAYNHVDIAQDGDRNKAKVDINFFSLGNHVDIDQTGNDNRAKVDIVAGGGNHVDIAQAEYDNKAVVDITPGFFAPSLGNDVDIDQTGKESVAKVSLHASRYNTIDVTQTNNDSSTVTASYSHHNSAVVVQN